MAGRPALRLISRSYCHLCELMAVDLNAVPGAQRIELEVVDVDEHPALLTLYDELVPVLMTPDGVVLCHYHLDEARVREYLQAFE